LLFVGTESAIAAFRRASLPADWCQRLRAPAGNRLLAREIERRGSAGNMPFALVVRLDWPLPD
jgi:hypothetical protein